MLHLSFALMALLLASLAGLANLATAKRLGGGGRHFLTTQLDGQVFAVGYDKYGQLGLGTFTNIVALPQAMLLVTNATDVSTGMDHSCILDGGSQVKCTGCNGASQLVDGTFTNRPTLGSVLGLESGIMEIYGGYDGSCVRTASGKAQCWGWFANMVKTSLTTITVAGGVQSISLGKLHACFAAVGGVLYCMGDNASGQLGTGSTTSQTTLTPVPNLAAQNIVSVTCGYQHTCAVNAFGAVFCWGEISNNQLGNPNVIANALNPVQVWGITSGAASAWTGLLNSFVLMQNGTVFAFGRDNYGVFGAGSIGNKLVPIVFGQGVSGVVEVRGGSFTTCVLLQNNQVKCTGSNDYGQFGVGSTTGSYTLVGMQLPTLAPTRPPTKTPTKTPTKQPTFAPTLIPTKQPTLVPTKQPTLIPTAQPTLIPTAQPTLIQTTQPTLIPTAQPTLTPTAQPTSTPSAQPTKTPTSPTTPSPTKRPAKAPTATPTKRPTNAPTTRPTKRPTGAPTKRPTKAPTAVPTKRPTIAPTKGPTKTLTAAPTKRPTIAPTKKAPTNAPTKRPTRAPTARPTKKATLAPTKRPTKTPTAKPTKKATLSPTKKSIPL
ncbi:hypothetical protein BASA81_007508 [Batrachochytrium salamandrivorans]|nr:hypothetical protein BASA81_007508 [Batrachochytrium salamandrivorans]